jgi:hypothetical protein
VFESQSIDTLLNQPLPPPVLFGSTGEHSFHATRIYFQFLTSPNRFSSSSTNWQAPPSFLLPWSSRGPYRQTHLASITAMLLGGQKEKRQHTENRNGN